MIDRTDGMDHVFCSQLPPTGNFGIAGLTAVQFPALLQNLRTSGTMNRSIHPTPAQQGGIGGIYDGVGVLACDVSLDQIQRDIVYFNFHLTDRKLLTSFTPAVECATSIACSLAVAVGTVPSSVTFPLFTKISMVNGPSGPVGASS